MTLEEIAQDENTAADFLDAVMTSDNAENNVVLDAQRAALAEARRRLIARRDQVNAWSRAGTTDMIRANWDGIAEGLQQARLLIGAMWDDLPVPTPKAVIDHEAAILAFVAEVNATPPTPEEEAALRRIDERVSEGLGFPVGYLREKQNEPVQPRRAGE